MLCELLGVKPVIEVVTVAFFDMAVVKIFPLSVMIYWFGGISMPIVDAGGWNVSTAPELVIFDMVPVDAFEFVVLTLELPVICPSVGVIVTTVFGVVFCAFVSLTGKESIRSPSP